MFSSFEGDFRTRPTVSIRGSNKIQTKEELLNKTREERKKREVLTEIKQYSHFRALRALQRSLRLPGGCVQLKLNLFLQSKEVILWSIVLSFLWEFLK